MPRPPSQNRSRARVERILNSAAALLAEAGGEKITVRALAAHSGVSLGTIYQFFEDIEAVRAAVTERTYADLRSVLEDRLTEEAAHTSPGGFFCTLIDLIGELQRRHPQMGCLVHTDYADGFRGAFAMELREFVAAHIRSTFARAFPQMGEEDRDRRLEVLQSAMLGALQVMPSRHDASRAEHLRQTKVLVSLYAETVFSSPLHARRLRK
ncbi:MAG: TetR/AcrR family transcriptional regulator [Xanthobacteraceae bacterium]